MFFKQIRRNAARNRRGNGLLFGSLVIAIIAFYTLLSLNEQDVMKFLKTIESSAVSKLLAIVPAVYAISLFFVFFLVFFACKYQMDSRRREFGMYLMLGMKRGRLFFMLLGETLWNSVISLLIGLPAALLLTEGVSLVTASLVGLGIIGHSVSFSLEAVMMTVVGFVAVQVVSMLIITAPYGKTEPAKFLHRDDAEKQAPSSKAANGVFSVLGVILLAAAYYIGLFRLIQEDERKLFAVFAAMLILGAVGTFLLFRGLGGIIGRRVSKKRGQATGLATFTGRQLQESVLSRHKTLAVSSLLLLVALTCISYGISVGLSRVTDSRTADFSLLGDEQSIAAVAANGEIGEAVAAAYPVYLSMTVNEPDLSDITAKLETLGNAQNAAQSFHSDYVIALSSFNGLMSAMGKSAVTLEKGEVALYSNINETKLYDIFREMLSLGPTIGLDGVQYKLLDELYTDNIVADRTITLYSALIVPDALFEALARDTELFCVNMHLKQSLVDELGLMNAIRRTGAVLDGLGAEYDSFLGGIGRTLFYTVAASYLTIYLGVLFLIISNTTLGTIFLIQQRENKHRYVTLLMLGANKDDMCRSAKKQIDSFFALALGVASFSSIVAIFILFLNFTRLPSGTNPLTVILLAFAALAVFVLTEVAYISIVKKNACREIDALIITDRG